MGISLSSIKEVWKVRRMSKLQVVRSRLKNKELHSRTPIAASIDVAFLFAEEMRQRPQGTAGLLNLNTKGQVINVQFGDIETFRNVREVISAAILSNAAASVMISNVDITDDMKLLTSRYKYALQLCSITLVDHVCISRSAGCKSYLSKGIMHNHPSGSTDPSFSDIYTTIRMQNAGKLLGIEVEDHIIVGALSEQKQSVLESDEYRKQLSKLADELHIEFKNIKDQQPVFKPSGISGKKPKKERKETEKSKVSQKGANDKFIKDYIQQAHNGSVAEREREHEK